MVPLEVHVDRSACRGSMSCVRRAPATFSLDAERRSVALNPAPDPESVLRKAAESCPFFAIQVMKSGATR